MKFYPSPLSQHESVAANFYKSNQKATYSPHYYTNKLLIIGAGIGQVAILKKARAKGIHVTVASIPGNYPCFELADDIIYEDIFNRDAIVAAAKQKGITAVISDQNDLMMPTVAYVVEQFGLPGNRFITVNTYLQ